MNDYADADIWALARRMLLDWKEARFREAERTRRFARLQEQMQERADNKYSVKLDRDSE